MGSNQGVVGSRYRRERATFKAQCQQDKAECWICAGAKGPIHYDAPASDPLAFQLDHLFPRSQRPELADDPGNWRASHAVCNAARGERMPVHDLGNPSPNPRSADGRWVTPEYETDDRRWVLPT